MTKRMLGKSGIEVSPFAFGGNVFGWTVNEATSFELLNFFVNAGYNFIDTADSYSNWVPGNIGGESETIIGKWMKQRGNRADVVIATKLGSDLGDHRKGLSKKYIFEAVEGSLNRLQTDYIDLYQAHYPDPTIPIEETLDAFTQLIKEGKVRAIGASNYSADQLSKALKASSDNGFARYETLQPLYNLYNRIQFELELEPICLKEEVGVISYFSLASGFLSGKYRSKSDLSKSLRGNGMDKYLNEQGFRILNALDEISQRYNVTQASIPLAWLIARQSVTAPIASATSTTQLAELLKAPVIQLDEDSIEQLNNASIELSEVAED